MSNRLNTQKRTREDEANDFMPLSKRINNLHLTNNRPSQENQQAQFCQQNNITEQHPYYNKYPPPGHENLGPPAGAHMVQGSFYASRIYNPELGLNENPHYFHKNKLLYELHFMRSRRCHNGDDLGQ